MNLILTPMKTYLTESFPWQLQTHSYLPYTNFTSWNTATLELYQAIEAELPEYSNVYHDSNFGMVIIRHRVKCMHNILLPGIPGAVFYGATMRSVLSHISGFNETDMFKLKNWHNKGACLLIELFGFSFGEQCLWITASDEKANINYACTIYQRLGLGWFTFAFRTAVTIYISYLLWYKYYKHIYSLEQHLRQYGHHRCISNDKISYELIIGDPTAPLLMNKWISWALFLDIWFGLGEIFIAIILSSQTDDIPTLLTSFMYLTRLVWNAYMIICFTNLFLKRFAMEHNFIPLDPTYIAIFVGIYSPIFAWVGGNIECVMNVLHYLVECMVPIESKTHCVDVALVIIFYLVCIGALPILYGRFIPQWNAKKVAPLNAKFASSFRYNNFKNRVFLALTGTSHYKKESNVCSLGGTIYTFLVANPRYMRFPTLCCRAADCFLLCINDKLLSEKIRISLLKLLDTSLKTNESSIEEATFSTPFIVHQLHIKPKKLTSKVQPRSKRKKSKQNNNVVIVKSTLPTAWCI
ncbi:hypothetical protein THRCLA_01413 [Thraustotheca clavata]|uniref:Transmembrane protein n=1 Tax=Thraustotheca clavata TaxID=74557 RepID=A0A1W0A8J2_9STRA|nr:hypothetical protein THRCLA_01413 [Thraustotheca clavata]